MDIVTIDLETYYDREYSLSKMTTEAYVRDPRFEVIGVGVKVNDEPTVTYSGSSVKAFIIGLDYSDKAILCHNTAFDGAILSWHYDVKPKLWLDTMSMARPLHKATTGVSLMALAEHYKLGAKGTEVIAALGKHRSDFTTQELAQYMDYCANDVELTYKLFQKLKVGFPVSELMVIDQTLRMYTEPKIRLDVSLLEKHHDNVLAKKQALLDKLGGAEAAKKTLMSNEMFAKLLRSAGIEPPTKVSLKTGKESWAFAKTDKAFTDLLEHPNPIVSTLVESRLGIKSTLEEKRTKNLIGVAERGALPIMLHYYGAHTGRFSGGDGLNFQNLPSRSDNTIRRALRAPDGHKLVAADSAQIEARMVAWVAGQDDLVQAFREGRDVYSEFASEVYGRKITKADKVERFVGKTCIAEGTPVLSDSGWKPIEQVSLEDKLWDGEEWVCHQGLLNNGIKQTLNLCGAWLTPDHLVWSGTKWLEAQSVVSDEDTLCRVLGTGAANLPLQATYKAQDSELKHSLFNATATNLSTRLTNTTSKILRALAAHCALRKQQLRNAIGSTSKLCQTMTTGLVYSTDSLRQSLDVTQRQTAHTNIMESVVLPCATNGVKTELLFYYMCRPLMDGISQITRWIGSMWTGTTNQKTYDSFLAARTFETNERLQTLKRVYDILNCGFHNRFTILTDAGPVIVHNCILGLGYGMGAEKFRRTLEIGQGGVNVIIDIEEAKRIVQLYRQKNHKIVGLWNKCGTMLTAMLAGGSGELHPTVSYDAGGIVLPNKMRIRYPALRRTQNGFEYLTDSRTYKKYMDGEEVGNDKWIRIYGGKAVENMIQAMARIVITDQMTRLGRKYYAAFQVHDEIIFVVPDAQVDQALADVLAVMSQPPSWAADLPVACEGGAALNYGAIEKA